MATPVSPGSPRDYMTKVDRIARNPDPPTKHNAEAETHTSLMAHSSDQVRHTTKHRLGDRTRRVLSIWWQEVVAVLFLVAAAIAVFVTLYPYQDKPLPDWPYAISIGALLSTYTVVLQSSATFLLAEGLAQLKWQWFDRKQRPLHDLVLHDDATRGPVGAFSLLLRLPLPMTWQWLACVLLLVTLLIGPFTQQVLQYHQCSVPIPTENARVPRTSLFMGQGPHGGAAVTELALSEQQSINAGLYSVAAPAPECASGNCTIPPYKSVGYCSSCEDVSSSLQITVMNDTNPLPPFNTTVTTNTSIPNGAYVVYQQGGTSIASRLDLASSQTCNDCGNFTAGLAVQILIGLPGTSGIRPYDTLHPSETNSCNDTQSHTNSTWYCQNYGAATCAFYPCVRTFSGNVTNGDYTETLIEETPADLEMWNATATFGNGPYVSSTLDTSCLTDDQRQKLIAAGVKLNATDDWVPYVVRPNQTNTGDPMPDPDGILPLQQDLIDRGCIYATDIFFGNGLSEYLARFFSGTLTGSTGLTGGFIYFDGPQLLQQVYNYGNPSLERTESILKNVSMSLSNYMRLNPGQHYYKYFEQYPALTEPAKGQTFTTKTCLHVNWGWLALPTAVAVLTLLFTFGVFITTAKLNPEVRTWKSSMLPLIYYGPKPDTSNMEQHLEGRGHLDAMNQGARRINVQLVKGENGDVGLQEQSRA